MLRMGILWARFRKALPTIVLAILGTYILSRLGILHGLERLVADAEVAASPQRSEEIRVVNITNDDYEKIFSGFPVAVHPEKLHDLIDAIARSKPRVISVDIDTSHPSFKAFKVDPSWPTVIWERDLATQDIQHEPHNEAEIEPTDVLGGQDPKLNLHSGIPQLLDDPEDKITRLYTHCVETKAGALPSLVHAVATAYRTAKAGGEARGERLCAEGGAAAHAEQLYFIRYSLRLDSSLTQTSAAQVMGRSGKREGGGQELPIDDFEGKVVLLGGTYRDFDRHGTPIGELPGIVVLANAIQTELGGKPVKALSRGWLFALELLSSTGLVVLFTLFPVSPVKLFAYGLAVSAAMSFGLSYLSFDTLSRFASFAPTLLAVLVFEIYEHMRHESIVEGMESGSKAGHGGHRTKP